MDTGRPTSAPAPRRGGSSPVCPTCRSLSRIGSTPSARARRAGESATSNPFISPLPETYQRLGAAPRPLRPVSADLPVQSPKTFVKVARRTLASSPRRRSAAAPRSRAIPPSPSRPTPCRFAPAQRRERRHRRAAKHACGFFHVVRMTIGKSSRRARANWLYTASLSRFGALSTGPADALLGDSSTVELRTLTPSILVRIQVPQPNPKSHRPPSCPVFQRAFAFAGSMRRRTAPPPVSSCRDIARGSSRHWPESRLC